MHVPKLICAICEREMYCSGNGLVAEARLADATPYYKVSVDEWACPECSTRILLPATAPRVTPRDNGYDNVLATYHVTLM